MVLFDTVLGVTLTHFFLNKLSAYLKWRSRRLAAASPAIDWTCPTFCPLPFQQNPLNIFLESCEILLAGFAIAFPVLAMWWGSFVWGFQQLFQGLDHDVSVRPIKSKYDIECLSFNSILHCWAVKYVNHSRKISLGLEFSKMSAQCRQHGLVVSSSSVFSLLNTIFLVMNCNIMSKSLV